MTTVNNSLASVSTDNLIAIHLLSSYHPDGGIKDALEAASSPSGSNKFITNSDTRLSDSRAPTGTASGGLSGSYPSPSVKGMTTLGVLESNAAHGIRTDGTLHSTATTVANGFMSSTDKTFLTTIANILTVSNDGTLLGTQKLKLNFLSPGLTSVINGVDTTQVDVSIDVGAVSDIEQIAYSGLAGTSTKLARADHVHKFNQYVHEIDSTAAFMNSGEGWTVITDMEYTPEPGDYVVKFNGSFYADAETVGLFAFFNDDTIVAESVRSNYFIQDTSWHSYDINLEAYIQDVGKVDVRMVSVDTDGLLVTPKPIRADVTSIASVTPNIVVGRSLILTRVS
jgi:hypothetical protein